VNVPLSPAATEAVCRVAAEIEPGAVAQLAQRPGALLTVLIHAARLGAEAAAPHIAAAKDAKLAAVRALAENLGDRSKDLNRLPPTDRRLMEPLRRMLLEILDAP